MTNAELIAEIRELAAKLDPNHLPTGLTKLRKAELEQLHSALFAQYMEAQRAEAQEARAAIDYTGAELAARRADEEALADFRLDPANLPTEPAVFPGDHRDGCQCEDCEAFYADDPGEWDDPTGGIAAPDDLPTQPYSYKSTAERDVQYREELDGVWDEVEALTGSETDPEFAAEVDALVARELAADPVPDSARRFVESLPITETDVAVSNVAVIVQSGSKLIWGRLIAVVNRRTRYSAPFLCTVELESGVRQLVAADDVLAA